jgi:peptide/nickel transport system substrate-binding protein
MTNVRSNRKRRLGVALLLAAGVIALISTTAASGAQKSTSLTIRVNSDWPHFDFQKLQLFLNQYIATLTSDSLLARDPVKGTKLIPYLASSWKVTPTSITFHLRKGPKCPDGSPVNALTVLNSFKRELSVGTDLGATFGPGPFSLKANRYKNTFTFTSATPNSDMIWGFAGGAKGAIVCPAGLAAIAADPHAFDSNAYGSGPYQIVSAQHAGDIVLKKNTQWTWGPKGVTQKDLADQITLKIITDETTAANSILTGAIDMGTVAGPDVARLSSSSLLHHFYHATATYPLYMNQRAGRITSDLQVRRAIYAAVDQQGYLQAALGGRGSITPSYIAQDTPCYNKNVAKFAPASGIASAQAIMKAAGWTLSGGIFTKNGQTANLLINTPTTSQGNVGDFLASALSEAGFKVTLQNIQYSNYALQIFAGNYDIAPASGLGGYPSAGAGIGYDSGPTPPTGSNLAATGADYPQYLAEIKKAFATTGATSCKHWQTVQEMVAKWALFKPLAVPIFDEFANKSKVASFSLNGQAFAQGADPRWIRLK